MDAAVVAKAPDPGARVADQPGVAWRVANVGPMPFIPADADIDPPTEYYFHGTKVAFAQGDVLLPRKEHDGAPTNAPLTPGGERHHASDGYVYVTTRLLLAWAYAHASGASGEPVVLKVEPQGPIEPDPEHSAHMYAYRCKSARVLVADDEPAISAEVAERSWKDATFDLNQSPKRVIKNVKRD